MWINILGEIYYKTSMYIFESVYVFLFLCVCVLVSVQIWSRVGGQKQGDMYPFLFFCWDSINFP